MNFKSHECKIGKISNNTQSYMDFLILTDFYFRPINSFAHKNRCIQISGVFSTGATGAMAPVILRKTLKALVVKNSVLRDFGFGKVSPAKQL